MRHTVNPLPDSTLIIYSVNEYTFTDPTIVKRVVQCAGLEVFDYLAFHTPAAMIIDGQLIGFDLLVTAKMPAWRRSVEALEGVISLLDTFNISYRLKYSGAHSLHLLIPFEALPEQFNNQSILSQRQAMTSKLRDYFQRHCGRPEKTENARILPLPYSLHEKSGLVSLPISRDGFVDFHPSAAHLYNLRVDQPWHANVPADAPEKTLRFLREVFKAESGPQILRGRYSEVQAPTSRLTSHVEQITFLEARSQLTAEDEVVRLGSSQNLPQG